MKGLINLGSFPLELLCTVQYTVRLKTIRKFQKTVMNRYWKVSTRMLVIKDHFILYICFQMNGIEHEWQHTLKKKKVQQW